MVWAVVPLFAVWLGATFVRQVRKKGVSVWSGMERFSLLPYWSFFAPNPARSDYRLMFRDRYVDGQLGLYRTVTLGGRTSWLNAVWNPTKRSQKALNDCVRGLARSTVRMPESSLKTTLPYLAILNHVTALRRTAASEATQFVIVEPFGH